MHTATQPRNTVTVEDKRAVFQLAAKRPQADVAKLPHEVFIRRMLKQRLGWGKNDASPDSLKQAARTLAAQFVARDKQLGQALAASEAPAAKGAA